MAADYLLYAVESLELKDGNNGIVKLEEIVSSGDSRKDNKSKFYVSTVVK